MSSSCNVEVVTGFLGWGKTTFIQAYLDLTAKPEDNTLVIQLENGRTKIDEGKLKGRNISIRRFKSIEEVDEKRFNRMIAFYQPKRIIFELNCMTNVDQLRNMLNDYNTIRKFKITSTISLVDAITIKIFLRNMSNIIQPNIQEADLLIINNYNKISRETLKDIRESLEQLNQHAHVMECMWDSLYENLKESRLIKCVRR